ncbi:bifunctional DNA-binding transcriptional regulator/O6-methylguanine-DNA methyltransferase Ada [Gluconacetobacter azotocaptans]|uniref:methylated-DNA--[protein]-cysteine S-methyltransferase n=1 Tax=Gluconacetobacter azotocaptans TaxID=142834 RepID=A0A7W4JSJ5_9PROT|nr:bifunctional DNA-binding transcriptional regulator/O6-methylguanine-DNA methyltransferase Ada [Gluconacetobacter azotocaptans]MBB2190104.1 bifunctional DNA-binding transcriptional regulator/O6-methylguanine-DNA methyltransferase Ada [Gluconacetobacter azotocaptans]
MPTEICTALARNEATERDPRWARIVARDRSADGLFWYSVATTGVYCRPSCPSRTAKPVNVRLHDTPADARAAGFRPCLRCRPDDAPRPMRNAAIVAGACRAIDQAEDMPSLDQLAGASGLSPAHFHRLFKAETGLTPRDYAVARRGARLRRNLAEAPTVTAAIFDAGYGSSSRFYEAAEDLLGMTPAAWRNGGAGQTLHFAIGQCALGALLVASSDKGVCAITLGDDPDALARDLQDRFPNADLTAGDAAYDALVARVVGFVEAPQLGLDLPLDIRGTAFQHRVWAALRAIPAGRTATYTQIARQIGAPGAVRAVAGACAANALAVAIPCHRVVRTDGSLSGYRWGVARKRALIAREASA